MSAVVLKLSDEEEKVFADLVGQDQIARLARLAINEADELSKWMETALGAGLTKIERTAVQTYIYRKLKGDLDGLPRIQLKLVSAETNGSAKSSEIR